MVRFLYSYDQPQYVGHGSVVLCSVPCKWRVTCSNLSEATA